jgi:hypothetical protein
MNTADLLKSAIRRRLALGELDERWVGEHRSDRSILLRCRPLTPGGELPRHRP